MTGVWKSDSGRADFVLQSVPTRCLQMTTETACLSLECGGKPACPSSRCLGSSLLATFLFTVIASGASRHRLALKCSGRENSRSILISCFMGRRISLLVPHASNSPADVHCTRPVWQPGDDQFVASQSGTEETQTGHAARELDRNQQFPATAS